MFNIKNNQFTKIKLLNELELLIDKANSKEENTTDIILLRKINAIIQCMRLLGFNSKEERQNLAQKIKGYSEYLDIILTNNEKNNNELIKYNNILLKKYLELYQYYQNVEGAYKETNVNQTRMKKATYEFLEMMGCMQLYEEMNNKEMIIRFNAENQNWCIDNYGLSYILLSDISENDSRYYTNLVHEMGHAFSNYILKNEDDWKCDIPVYGEIISYMFERIFFQFIYDNSFLSLDELRKIIAHFEAVKVNSLYYGIGTSQIIESKKYSITKDGHVMPTEDWINNSKSKSIFSNVENIDDYTPWISLIRHPYIVGSMASIKLVLEYMKDNKDFISKLPETIMSISKLPTNQLIEKYCSVSHFEPFFMNNFFDYKVKKK